MKTFYFTFQLKHPFKDYIQPIVAENGAVARELMFEVYGSYWGFQHGEEEYMDCEILRSYTHLPLIEQERRFLS